MTILRGRRSRRMHSIRLCDLDIFNKDEKLTFGCLDALPTESKFLASTFPGHVLNCDKTANLTSDTAKMVLYHSDGRVVKAHEDYLEQQAQNHINDNHYDDQARIVRASDPKARDEKKQRVQIRVDKQCWEELYGRFVTGKTLTGFDVGDQDPAAPPPPPIPPEGLDIRTLMRCSSLADEFFTFKPGETVVTLPVCYPRYHRAGAYATVNEIHDIQMAYIREDEITAYIIPWLKEMESIFQKNLERVKKKTKNGVPNEPEIIPLTQLASIGIPELLLEKIHLYNAMLQLGIATHFQRPLVDALILQMYQTNLQDCHLDTLEMTVCRFYSRGMAILDPVINHFVGTYSLRSATERGAPTPPEVKILLREVTGEEQYLPPNTTRSWLEYKNVRPDPRRDYPDDMISLPPLLEVLGHCIRHWSGVRRNGSTAAAHTGFPLNVGRVFKYYRRKPTDVIRPKRKRDGDSNKDPRRNTDYADYSTHRLRKNRYFLNNPPGGNTAPPTNSGNPRVPGAED
jgi:hypothetical protein